MLSGNKPASVVKCGLVLVDWAISKEIALFSNFDSCAVSVFQSTEAIKQTNTTALLSSSPNNGHFLLPARSGRGNKGLGLCHGTRES